ncbi:uncharacterized protein [Antedon mediterranea]|uniref:uncharacterized protein n=1 Tax=Antedon mediterranea TaxID=105859 RepID=UPI003AF571BA
MAVTCTTRCVIAVCLVATLLSVLMATSEAAKQRPRGFGKGRTNTRNSWKASGIGSRKSCLTDKDTQACGMGGRGWLQNLSECCAGFKCVYVIKKINNLSQFKPTPVCKRV